MAIIKLPGAGDGGFDLAGDPWRSGTGAGASKRLEPYLENLRRGSRKNLFFGDASDDKQFAERDRHTPSGSPSPSQKNLIGESRWKPRSRI